MSRLWTLIFVLVLLTVGITQAQDDPGEVFNIIVEVNTAYTPESSLPNAYAIQSQRMNIRTAQDNLLSTLDAEDTLSSITRYDSLPYLAMEVDAAGLARLEADPNVTAIYPNKQYELLATPADLSNALQGSSDAWALGYDGAGQVIAVFDAGFDFNHPALTGKAIEEACFTSTSLEAGTTTTCPNGENSQIGAGSSLPSGFPGTQQPADHGQHVAGTIAGDDGNSGGFRGAAPGASLIGVNVFARVNANGNVIAFDADIIKAMEWLYNNRDELSPAAVNMSLGGGAYSSESACNLDNIPFRNAAKLLTDAGIAVIAASGNAGNVSALSAPACITEVISVGAVEVGGTNAGLVDDDVPSFSNSAPFLDLLAPGDLIYSTIFDDDYGNKRGTSMATPHASAAWAIVSQAFPYATLDEKLAALKSTGVQVTDSGSGVTTPRVQVDAALGITVDPVVPVFPLDELNSTEAKFEWQRSAYARHYRLVIWKDGGEVFNQLVNPACISNICSYTLAFMLEEGTGYTWQISAVSPLGSQTTPSSEIPFEVGITVSSVPADLSFNLDSLTNTVAPVRPTFKWTHRENETDTTVPGHWYNVEISQGGSQTSIWYPVQQICEGLRCEVKPTRDEFLIGLNNGVSTWRVRFWTPEGGIQGWSDSQTITIELERPVVPQNVVVDGSTGRPVITWSHDPNATWFNVWVGTSDLEQIHFEWYEKTDAVCSGLTCTLVPDAHPLETGTYAVWMRSWGPVGFSDSADSLGWAGQFDFPVDNAAPQAVSALTGTDENSGRPTFSWLGVDDATWYQVQIRDTEGENVVLEWHSAYDLGCGPDEQCTLVPQAVLDQNATYGWRLQAWGPGGFNMNASDFFVSGMTFTVSAAAPTPPTPITPTGETRHSKPTFTWTGLDDGSWYNVQVFNNGESEPFIEDWFPAESLGCNISAACATQINTWLGNGTYQWRVRAYTPVDVGPFSEKITFTVVNSP